MATILSVFLFLTKEYFLIPFVLLGIYYFDRKIFLNALGVLLFSIVLNTFLKSIWQTPLANHIQSDSWAFPSGHMQSACVFWGYLALQYRKLRFSLLVSIILLGVGYALVYFGWHKPIDIFGGLFFGGLIIISYSLLQRYTINEFYLKLIFIIASFVFIYLLPKTFMYVWLAVGSLIGVLLGDILYKPELFDLKPRRKIISLILSAIFVMLIYVGFSKIDMDMRHKNLLQFALIGFVFSSPYVKDLAHIIELIIFRKR